MEDRELMEDLLMLEKGVCDLYMHGTIESSTGNVRGAFSSALNSSLSMQDSIYTQMSDKGWYATDCAEGQKIQQVRSKFSC